MTSQRIAADGVYVTLPELIALRALAKQRPWFADAVSQTNTPGEQRSRERGRGIEFEELRPYLPGDDIRRIDWRTSARKGTPYTKLFTIEREQSVFLAVDQRAPLFFGSGKYFKSVTAARVAALLGWSSVWYGHRFSGVVIGQSVWKAHARTSKRALLQLLHALTEANHQLSAKTSQSVDPLEMLSECITNTPRHTTVLIVSDFSDWHDKASLALQQLSHNRTVRLVRIVDELEDTLPRNALVGISDGQTPRQIGLTKTSQARHQKHRSTLEKKLKDDCQRFGVSLSVLYTHESLSRLWSHTTDG